MYEKLFEFRDDGANTQREGGEEENIAIFEDLLKFCESGTKSYWHSFDIDFKDVKKTSCLNAHRQRRHGEKP